MVWVPHFEKPNLGYIGHFRALATASRWSWYVFPTYALYILHSVTDLFVDCPSQLSEGSLVLLFVPPGSERKEQLSGGSGLGKAASPKPQPPFLQATRHDISLLLPAILHPLGLLETQPWTRLEKKTGS